MKRRDFPTAAADHGSPPAPTAGARDSITRAYIAREAMISAAINGALGLVAMAIVFGRAATIPLWGWGNLAFDTVPQSFIVAAMATLVPGLLAQRKRRLVAIDSPGSRSGPTRALLFRALSTALVGTLLGTAIVAAALAASGLDHLTWTAAALLKMLYGGSLGYAVTRATLPVSLV